MHARCEQIGLIGVGRRGVLGAQLIDGLEGRGAITTLERLQNLLICRTRLDVTALDSRFPPAPTGERAESNDHTGDEPRTVLAQPSLDALPLLLLVVKIVDHALSPDADADLKADALPAMHRPR